jgi:hypothetical protein
VEFAKEIKAKVSGLTVTKPFHVFTTDVMELEDNQGNLRRRFEGLRR